MIDILLAVGIDLMLGDPQNFPHPIKLMGNLIVFEEKLVRKWAQRLNRHHLQGGVHLTSQPDRHQRLDGHHLQGSVHLATNKTHRHHFQSGSHLLLAGGFFIIIINLCLAFFIPYLLLKQLSPYPSLYHLKMPAG
jgi:cobalamin biosynthesis protein CobD/CbiB